MSWEGEFGAEYLRRNPRCSFELDQLYEERYGITRTKMNERFVGNLSRRMKVLEVGCGGGAQMDCLDDIGFSVTGIDIYEEVVKPTGICGTPSLYKMNAEDMSEFKDKEFNLVFTSGLLIHIPPDKLEKVMSEIYRVSQRYIWGFEYFSDSTVPIMIPYRGMDNMLWKANYPMLYFLKFNDLMLVDFQLYQHLDNPDNVDAMFLLKKTTGAIEEWEKIEPDYRDNRKWEKQ